MTPRSRSPSQSSKPRAKDVGLLAILAYDQLRTFEYAIAAEVFGLVRPGLGVPWYRTEVVAIEAGAMRGIAGVSVRASAAFDVLASASTIVIPGWRDVSERPPERLLKALRAAADRGARLLSICSGAFVLAAAGLLDGRRAATHWLYSDQLRADFPKVEVDEDVLYVDAGNIITSAGSAAGIDACLHLVRRDFGARIANLVARRMVTAPHREGGQRQYVEASLPSAAGSAGHRLQDVLVWAQAHLDQSLPVSALAARACMSPRQFLRQFRAQLGMAPTDWLLRERCQRARSLLEATPLSHEQIARHCGYESCETFRVAFRRGVGVAPAEYRRRFRLSTGATASPGGRR
jgi:AraC family transcriptional activator FtrA